MSVQRAEEIYRFVKEYIQTQNIAPSVREICEGVGIRSTSTVHRYLHRLETDGRIRMATGKNRAIVVSDSMSEQNFNGIPVLQRFQPNLFTNENIVDYVKVDLPQIYENVLFAVRATEGGDTGIIKDDIVIVEQNTLTATQDIAVIITKDNAFSFSKGIEDRGDVIGKVVAVIRYF
ncbi:MAG TPA: hypothetical protein DCO72_05205 [Ruminococcus sp.]|nr:hypothetical protein [Ruminococcus sp.]